MADIVFPHSATLFAAICACVFVVVGVLGKCFQLIEHVWFYISFYVFSLPGNLITILALLKCPKMRGHATTAFVLSLSISDLLFCSFSLPLTAVRFFHEVGSLYFVVLQIY